MIVVAVAVLYVALAISNGGYSRELTAGATVAVWWAVLIAIALGGRPRSRVPTPALGAGICLAALAGWTAISIGWASDNGSAFFEAVRVLGYLGLFVLVRGRLTASQRPGVARGPRARPRDRRRPGAFEPL